MSSEMLIGRRLANPEADCEVVRGPCALFDTDSESQISHIFQVTDMLKQIKVFEKDPATIITIEMVGGSSTGDYFTPMRLSGGTAVQITGADTYLLMPWPGRYRLTHNGPIGSVIAVCEDVLCCNGQIIAGGSL